MKKKILNMFFVSFCMVFTICNVNANETLYEKYSNASSDELNTETQEMSKMITASFDEREIKNRQDNIDFSEYFSNLQSLIYFGTKLANYGTFEEDLRFGRDRELFKGIPDQPNSISREDNIDRKDYVNDKYKGMKKNIHAEVNTYDDMAKINLDVCQSKYEDIIFRESIVAAPIYKKRMERYFRSKEYRSYEDITPILMTYRPNLASEIEKQVALWQAPRPSPGSPVIDPAVVNIL